MQQRVPIETNGTPAQGYKQHPCIPIPEKHGTALDQQCMMPYDGNCEYDGGDRVSVFRAFYDTLVDK